MNNFAPHRSLAADISKRPPSSNDGAKDPHSLNPQDQHGLFLVTDTSFPVLDTQALANDIVARIERDFAEANLNRSSATYVPISYFEPRPDTPVVVLRRVLKSLYSLAFSA